MGIHSPSLSAYFSQPLSGFLLFLVLFRPQCDHLDFSLSSFLLPTVSIIFYPFDQSIYPFVLLLYQHGFLQISTTRKMLSSSARFCASAAAPVSAWVIIRPSSLCVCVTPGILPVFLLFL